MLCILCSVMSIAKRMQRQIGVRMPDELIVRIDHFIARTLKVQPDAILTRSDAVRVLVEKGLEHFPIR